MKNKMFLLFLRFWRTWLTIIAPIALCPLVFHIGTPEANCAFVILTMASFLLFTFLCELPHSRLCTG